MIFFEVDAPTIRTFSVGQKFPTTCELIPNQIYIASKWQIKKLLRQPDAALEDGNIQLVNVKNELLNRKIPINIGFGGLGDALDVLPRAGLKIGIINGMGRALGDNLVGMTALRVFRKRLEMAFPLDIALYQFNPDRVSSINARCGTVDRVYQLPITLDHFLELDAYVDLSEKFNSLNNMPLVDWFLSALSVDPASVSNDEKRNYFKIDKFKETDIDNIFVSIKEKQLPILLFHHRSNSKLRSMPDGIAADWIENILNTTKCTIVSAVELKLEHQNFIDLSKYSQSLDKFACIVKNCDAMISVDTLSFHLADAFDIPSVVLFATIEPEYRLKFYPNMRGILISDKNNQIYGLNSESKNLVEKKKQIEVAAKCWKSTSLENVLKNLKTVADFERMN